MPTPQREVVVAPDRFEIVADDALLVARLQSAIAVCIYDAVEEAGALLHLRFIVRNPRPAELTDTTLATELLLLDRCIESLRETMPGAQGHAGPHRGASARRCGSAEGLRFRADAGEALSRGCRHDGAGRADRHGRERLVASCASGRSWAGWLLPISTQHGRGTLRNRAHKRSLCGQGDSREASRLRVEPDFAAARGARLRAAWLSDCFPRCGTPAAPGSAGAARPWRSPRRARSPHARQHPLRHDRSEGRASSSSTTTATATARSGRCFITFPERFRHEQQHYDGLSVGQCAVRATAHRRCSGRTMPSGFTTIT